MTAYKELTDVIKNEELNEVIDAILEIILDQKILLDHGGSSYIDFNDLESLDFEDCAKLANDIEYELVSILRKEYLRSNPHLGQLSRDIAINLMQNQEENN
jgi:hypothetical protein